MVMPAQQQVGVSLNLAEVYAHLCPKCQSKMRSLIKDKVSDQMVDQIIGFSTDKNDRKGD
jgi:hypothetical protein